MKEGLSCVGEEVDGGGDEGKLRCEQWVGEGKGSGGFEWEEHGNDDKAHHGCREGAHVNADSPNQAFLLHLIPYLRKKFGNSC